MASQRDAARDYVRRIKNDQKRAYAENVYSALMIRRPLEEVPYPGLPYMAAQAVRSELRSLLGIDDQEVGQ